MTLPSSAKTLIIGGGIANFTNVADTFKGIMRALRGAKTKVCKASSHISRFQ